MLLDDVFSMRGALFDCSISAPALVRSAKTFAHNLAAVHSRNMNPKTTKMMLRIHMKTPTGSVGTSVDRMTETPEVPPNAK